MNTFYITLLAVAVLLLAAVAGYVLVKKRTVGEESAASLSKILLYICQPCLAVHTFSSATFSRDMVTDVLFFLILATVIQGVMLLGGVLILKKKFSECGYRIFTIAIAFANCAFFGIPIIEALLPDIADGLIIFTTLYATVMNILGWTVGSAIISGSTKIITLKRVFVNPTMIGLAIAILFAALPFTLPATLTDMISITGRMTTPLSMIIMGMRLATTEWKTVFGTPRAYAAVFAKGILMPLIAFIAVYFIPLPMSREVMAVFFIITACPTASIVLNFSELIGEGQREAAASVLLSTILSIVTLPIMMLLLPLLI